MAKRQNRNRYVGNTRADIVPPKRVRKGKHNEYKIPKVAQQKNRDRAYIGFQSEPGPRLNKVTSDLHIRSKCDTIIGGIKAWLKGERPDGSEYKFPIILFGTRCDNDATASRRIDGKTVKRCPGHTFAEAWINTGEADEVAKAAYDKKKAEDK